MTDRDRAIGSVEKALEVSAALRRQLLGNERMGRKMISALRRDTPISESVEVAGGCAAELRRSTNDLLAEYELARHQMRAAFLLPSLDEGMSIGDISRKLGVSRQLASRLVKEAKETASAGVG
jgi:hypothetical protein